MLDGLIAIGRIAAGMIGVKARIAVETIAAAMEVAAETVADVGGHIGVHEGMAPKPDQCHDELKNQNGAADCGADNEYGSHSLSPFSNSPRNEEQRDHS